MGFGTVLWRMKMMSSDTAVRVMAVKQIGATGAVDPLRRALSDPSRAVRVAAADSLSDLGEAGFQVLARALQANPDPLTRTVVAAELARCSHHGAVGALVSGLDDQDIGVFNSVCDALAARHATGAIPALHHVMATADIDRRITIMHTLMAIPDARSVRPLVKALDDQDGRVRSMAAKALSVFGTAQQVLAMCNRTDLPALDEDDTDAVTDPVPSKRYTRRLRIQRLHEFN